MRNNQSAISLMNEYGRNRKPFLFIIDFDLQKPKIIPLTDVDPQIIKYNINGFCNYHKQIAITKPLKFKKMPVSFGIYKKAFDEVLENILYGNSYLLNLTFPTQIQTNYSLSDIFQVSKAKYKLLVENKFVVFSPEIFIQIKNRQIATFPMKGTIDAGIKNARVQLLNNEKEFAEHVTIVDLLRNDISRYATNVRVEKFRYIDEIKTNNKNLLQVSSKIVGNLPDNYSQNLGDIVIGMLPAGSISGAPKIKTIEVIKSAEPYERGYYSGIFGYFDGENLDSGIMIRYIENINEKLYYKSGGGLTFMSNPEDEYNELIDKVYVPIN